MRSGVIVEQIEAVYGGLPAQMQLAARFVVERPSDVALLSMREQARRAGVPAATMTRLAKRLGLAGYDELRAAFAEAVRDSAPWFSNRAANLVHRTSEIGEAGVAAETAEMIARSVAELTHPHAVGAIVAAADLILEASRIYCFGSRATFPVAYLFAYSQSYFWDRAVLLDGAGGTGVDALLQAGPADVLFVVSLSPYAASSVEAAEIAARNDIRIVAVTDSRLSPVARPASVTIQVSPRSPSFFDTISPALAASEMLVALIASRLGGDAPAAVRAREDRLREAGVFWRDGRGRR